MKTDNTHKCKVQWSGYDYDDWVEITSPTGKTLRCYIVRIGYYRFTIETQELFKKLMDGPWATVREWELTNYEMQLFKCACELSNGKKRQ